MARAVVGDRFVDLVADQHQVVTDDDVANGTQFVFAQHRADRIPGRIQQQHSWGGGHCRLDRLRPKREAAMFDGRSHRTNPAAAEQNRWLIRVVDRVGQQHLVAFVQKGSERRVNAECGPGGDEDFRVGVVREPVVASQLGGDSLAQRLLTAVVRIARAASFHRCRRRLDDVRRRVEVRFAAHQRNDRASARLCLPDLGQNRVDGSRFEQRGAAREM